MRACLLEHARESLPVEPARGSLPMSLPVSLVVTVEPDVFADLNASMDVTQLTCLPS